MKQFIKILFILLIFNAPNLVFGSNEFFLTYIKVNHLEIDKNQNPKKALLLSQNNDIQIEFLPIKLDSVKYKYQLENYEMDWISTDYPVARYMNLPFGTYNFVIIANQNGKEVSKFQYDFEVQKSVSEAWWFYPMLALYGLILIGGGIYLFFLYNFRQKMKVQKIRNKLAADLHDEIGSSLSSIAMSSNFIEQNYKSEPPELLQILSQIKADSEDTVNTIRDTVWALHADNDSIEILIEKIHSFALQMFVNKDIRLTFENKIKLNKMPKLNLDARKNLFLIAKEAINNITKHSNATEAKIIFTQSKENVFLNISDNGKGYNLNENFEGNGLKNFKKRADESYMELKIESKIGGGTNIYLEVPVI